MFSFIYFFLFVTVKDGKTLSQSQMPGGSERKGHNGLKWLLLDKCL